MTKQFLGTVLGLAMMAMPALAVEDPLGSVQHSVDARLAGLGGSTLSTTQDGNATFWNPAGLALATVEEVSATGFQAFEAQTWRFKLNRKVGRFGLGAGYVGTYVSDIANNAVDPDTDRVISAGGSFDSNQDAAFVAAGYRVTDQLGVGAVMKRLSIRLFNAEADAIGVDVGAQYSSKKWIAGATLQNAIRPVLEWQNGSQLREELSRRLHLGLNWHAFQRLWLSGGVIIQKETDTQIRLGGDLRLHPMIHFRAGFETHSQPISDILDQLADFKRVSLGAGLILDPVTVDVAWTTQDVSEIGPVVRFTVGYKFLKPKHPRKKGVKKWKY